MSKTKTRIKKGFMAAVAAMLSICTVVPLFSACFGSVSLTVSLDKSSATMYEGDTLTLTASVNKDGAAVTWSSDATHIAVVDAHGVVTALAEGEVTVKAKYGGAKAECEITVVKKPEVKPEPEPEKPQYHEGTDATCTSVGNTEFWTKAGKYYSDEECLHEIERKDTVIAALGHDFKNGKYMFDETSHWRTCARKNCGIDDAKTNHVFTNGVCECGKEKPVPPPPQGTPIEKKTNAEVRANPGKWFYHIDGQENSDYTFSSLPSAYDDSSYSVSFAEYYLSKANNKFFYFRYQPVYEIGTDYILTFKAVLSSDGTIRYGAPAKKEGGGNDYSTFETVQVSAGNIAEFTFGGTVNDIEPFSVRIDSVSESENVTLTISQITVSRVTMADKYAEYFRIGAAVQAGKLANGYGGLMKNFNSVTPENSMKWKNIEASEGVYTYNRSGDSADALVKWAKENNAGVRGHCLLWYKSLPAWLHDKFDSKPYSESLKASALGYIDRNIENVMKHFGNGVYVWDVVNEALFNSVTASKLNDKTHGIYGNIWRTNDNMSASSSDWVDWYKVCGGYEYIAHAFKKADEVRRANNLDVDLFYNDYGLNDPYKRQACLNLVQMLRDSGAPIDGIGMQAHYKLDSYTADKTTWLKNFEDSVKAFTDAGLDVQITELDIRFEGEITEELEREQGEMFGKIFQICRKYAKAGDKEHGVTGVTTWGVQDGCNGAWDDGKYPLVFGTDKQPKKAFYEIMNF